jgi:transposase
MDSRTILIASWLRGEATMSELCDGQGISRKTGYKWLERYREAGVAGLIERSRARHTQTRRVEAATAEAVLALRRTRPTWGPEEAAGATARGPARGELACGEHAERSAEA